MGLVIVDTGYGIDIIVKLDKIPVHNISFVKQIRDYKLANIRFEDISDPYITYNSNMFQINHDIVLSVYIFNDTGFHIEGASNTSYNTSIIAPHDQNVLEFVSYTNYSEDPYLLSQQLGYI